MNSVSRRVLTAILVGGTAMTLTAVPASAVSGGTPVTGEDSPAAAVVRITIDKPDTYHRKQADCTGVVISEYWLISAASCFADNPAQWQNLPAGPFDRDNIISDAAYMGPTPEPRAQSTYDHVVELVPRRDRDLVLARTAYSMYHVAKLATTPPVAGQSLKLVGTGRTGGEWIPGQAHMTDATVSAVNTPNLTLTGSGSTCRGDAGGPAFRENNGTLEVVAIHGPSFQRGCLGVTETRSEMTEARVDDIYEWIRQEVPDLTVDCEEESSLYINRGGILWRDHIYGNSARNGSYGHVTANSDAYGPNWLGAVYGGRNGLVWEVHKKVNASDPFADGDVRLWRRNGEVLTGGERVGTGWTRQLQFPTRMTVDSEGRIYTVNATGELRSYLWNDTTKTWVNAAGDVIDTGWQSYTSITAAGDGVLYARTSSGQMFRFKYNHTTKQWTQRNKDAGSGWNAYTSIFSPGADILYGLGSKEGTSPALRWHRYYPESDRWAPRDDDGLGKVIETGTDWTTTYRGTADPGACRLNRP
ncbi:tachylectin-related carbohydrate-binding protein [Kibdelosporangium persicum]|nr:tachylectin-related carbohydrate-binding protein [Kibdelosporangium persicum]